jgi:L-ribulokinase
VGVTGPGAFVMIMGTSTCDILLGDRPAVVEGMCGMVEDGVVPGLFGFEAGQSAVGDIFAWFAETAMTPHEILELEAAKLRPGQSGLLALDWWNGNRSVLVDADLRGLLVGMTLATKPAEIYRALIESTAFGTRMIVEAFEAAGVAVDSVVACGGLPERNKLLMQIYADVLGREITVGASTQAPALGAAMFAAVAAGEYGSIAEASQHMTRPGSQAFAPAAEAVTVYSELYAEYVRLNDLFGRGGDEVMRNLKRLQAHAFLG